jgi:uncharacterized protein YjbJ (UPF0337 family)
MRLTVTSRGDAFVIHRRSTLAGRMPTAKGKVKEEAGRVSGNDSLSKTGKSDRVKRNLEHAGEKVKERVGLQEVSKSPVP